MVLQTVGSIVRNDIDDHQASLLEPFVETSASKSSIFDR